MQVRLAILPAPSLPRPRHPFADDRLHLLIGGRYDWADIGNGFSPNSNAEATGPFNAATGVGLPIAFDKAFSPRLGAVVQPAPWLSFYASLGLTNAIPVPGQPLFPPQKGTQYEGGAKAEFFDRRLTATLAFYDITKTNIPQAIAGSVFSSPVGLVESKGVEFDIAGRINENWSLIGSYSHDDAHIVNGQGPSDFISGVTVNESGNRLQNVPLNSGKVLGDVGFAQFLRGSIHHASRIRGSGNRSRTPALS